MCDALDPNDPNTYYQARLPTTRFWVQRVLFPIVLTIGIIGNMVTLVIMTRRRMRSSTNHYLAALALFDMLYLIFAFLHSLEHYQNITDERNYAYWVLKPFFYMFADVCSNTSVWLTAAFTLERYIAVCHPMKGKVLCTESRAKKAIVAVFIFSLAFTSPTALEWKVGSDIHKCTNKTILKLVNTSLGMNTTYKNIFYWLTVVLYIVIPFISLAVFNSFLIHSVHQSKVRRSKMTRLDAKDENAQENKITIMLIAVVILFMVCQLPTAFHLLYNSLYEPEGEELFLLAHLGNVFNLLVAINAAGNFVLYSLFSQKFRKIFMQIFCPCILRKAIQKCSAYTHSTATRTTAISEDTSEGDCGVLKEVALDDGGKKEIPIPEDEPSGQRSTFRTAFWRMSRPLKKKKSSVSGTDVGKDSGSSTIYSRCRRALVEPWNKLKRSMGMHSTAAKEQEMCANGINEKANSATTDPNHISANDEEEQNTAL